MFIHAHRRIRPLTRLGRFSAVVCMGVVALLAWCAVDPEAHEFFHRDAHASGHDHAHSHDHHEAPTDDHHCVITDFERGATDELLSIPTLLAVALLTLSRLTPTQADVPARRPRGWLPRAQAPPSAV